MSLLLRRRMLLSQRKSKNLFDYNYYFENKIVILGSISGAEFQLKPNTAYTFSTNIPFTNYANVFAKIERTLPSTQTNGFWLNKPITITTDNTGIIYISSRDRVETGTKEIAITLKDFQTETYWVQIEEGSVATGYEPFY